MAISKEARITTLIAIDVLFFLVEIVIGYWAHSLALVADAFHMLNDVLSLCVGLWAVRVATSKSSNNEYTYGWARAEILGGLVNGVFLIALCMTIFLEAIQRFVEPQEVSQPKFVLVVGGVGLAFNVLGLFVFHQHGHSHDHGHGADGHSHGTEDELSSAEHGHSGHQHLLDVKSADKSKAQHSHSMVNGVEHVHDQSHRSPNDQHKTPKSQPTSKHGQGGTSVSWSEVHVSKDHATSPLPARRTSMSGRRSSALQRSGSRSYGGIEDLPIHPVSLRNNIMAQARMGPDTDSESNTDVEDDVAVEEEDEVNSEISPLLKNGSWQSRSRWRRSHRRSKHGERDSDASLITHSHHKHAQPRSKSRHVHSHEDMNIKGVFLHVLGDALGNVGVMASALIIWLTPWSFRFYFDPAISLLITLIILKTAIPLVKQTSKPLLQAVPDHVQIDEVRADIESLPGIRSCHHIHVWTLTPSKLIATLDVQLNFDFEGKGAERYMALVKEIKNCLRGHGIQNSTIQPEFCLIPDHAHGIPSGGDRQSSSSTVNTVILNSKDGPKSSCENGSCLLDDPDKQCCGPASGTTTPKKPADTEQKHDHGKNR